jgi:hypothetical protein
MDLPLFTIASLANRDIIFNPVAAELGFGLAGEIDRFIFNVYAKSLRETVPAGRPRGTIFVLEPATESNALASVAAFKPMLREIQTKATKAFHTVRVDLEGGLSVAYACTPADRTHLVSGGWSQQMAQHFSRSQKKCVVWAIGVGVIVYISGDIYLESADVIEEFAVGFPGNFQDLSWDDGTIVFEFAKHKLNDASAGGVWQLPDNYLLRPRPEELIRRRLGEFLQFRLAGYRHHDEEAHVENEGRADISLHLIDGRILIVEVKWIGCSLVATRIGSKKDAIRQAIASNSKGWLTQFDDVTITSGLRQLVIYYATSKYQAAYLAVFDFTESAAESCCVPVPVEELGDHNPAHFRILRARVDPRSASKRAKS